MASIMKKLHRLRATLAIKCFGAGSLAQSQHTSTDVSQHAKRMLHKKHDALLEPTLKIPKAACSGVGAQICDLNAPLGSRTSSRLSATTAPDHSTNRKQDTTGQIGAASTPKRSPDPFFNSVARRLPTYHFSCILDVGANLGQSCIPMAIANPKARILAFEPVPSTYAILCEKLSQYPSIIPINAALGATEGKAWMTSTYRSPANRIVDERSAPLNACVEVTLLTGAEACRKYHVENISMLKIDAEGLDLEVLRGFLPVLDTVDFIKVEAGMNSYNKTHVPFHEFHEYLSQHGFLLYHIYEQCFEFKKGGRPVLRRCNPVYINHRLVDLGLIT